MTFDELKQKLLAMKDEITQLTDRLSNLEEELDDLTNNMDLDGRCGDKPGGDIVTPPASRPPQPGQQAKENQFALAYARAIAAMGVESLTIHKTRNGHFVAYLGSPERRVHLISQDGLVHVLRALAHAESNVKQPAGALVPFKSTAELLDLYETYSGARISAGAFNQLTTRLRHVFLQAFDETGHVNVLLIATSPFGRRFNLRLGGKFAFTSDVPEPV